MRVLHLSHKGLPDPRIEKAAITARKLGAETYFAGGDISSLSYPMKVFDRTFKLPFGVKVNVGLRPWWNALKRNLEIVLKACKPDLIHAHDVIAAKLAIDSGVPTIYDDHEYWSMKSRYRIGKITDVYRWIVWTAWEKEVLRKATAIITISDEVAKRHSKVNRRVFIVPNLPMAIEVKGLEKSAKRNRLSSVYIGSLTSPQPSFRRVNGLIKLFLRNDIGDLIVIGDRRLRSLPPIYSVGFMRHDLLMKELAKHHIGILPFKKHPFHRFCNPNRPYEYACAGLVTLITSDIEPVKRMLGRFCKTFNDYEELLSLLRYYRDNLDEAIEEGLRTMKFAREKLIWERFEDRIFKAYKIASLDGA